MIHRGGFEGWLSYSRRPTGSDLSSLLAWSNRSNFKVRGCERSFHTVDVANAAVQVDLGVVELAVLAADAGAEDPALVDVDGLKLAGLVEVRHVVSGLW